MDILLLIGLLLTTSFQESACVFQSHSNDCQVVPRASLLKEQTSDVAFVLPNAKGSLVLGLLVSGSVLEANAIENASGIKLEGPRGDWPAPVIISIRSESGRSWRVSLDKKNVERLTALYAPPGRYELVISSPEFKDVRRDLSFVSGKPVKIGAILMQPRPVLSGRVIDGVTKVPLSGVALRSTDGEVLGFTGDDGDFRLDRSAVKTTVEVVAPGYGVRFVNVPDGTETLELPPVELAHGASLRLVITPEAWQPGGLTLTLSQIGSGFRTIRSQVVNEPATVRWDEIPGGGYNVRATGPGPLQQFAKIVELGSGEDREIRLEIRRTTIRFQTRMSDRPTPFARITISGGAFHASFDTGPEGERTEEIWQDGEFLVLSAAKESTSWHASVREITAGHDDTWRFDLPAGSIIGRVVDSQDGEPVVGAKITLSSVVDSVQMMRPAESDREGKFVFTGIETGPHTITVSHQAYTDSDPVQVLIQDRSDPPALTIRMSKGVTQNVRVVDWNGNPVAGAELFGVTASGEVRSRALSGVNGEVVVQVSTMTQSLIGVSPQGSLGTAPLSFMAGQSLTLVLLAPTVALQANVRMKDGQAVPGVRFLLRFNGQFLAAEIVARLEQRQEAPFVTDTSGHASLRGLPEGVYDVWPVSAAGNAPAAGDPVSILARPGTQIVDIVVAPPEGNVERRGGSTETGL